MPSYDNRTLRGWPLPFRSNTLEFDVERLRETFTAIDEALSALEEGTRTLLNERVAGLEEKQYILDERMEVIAGQTTEDSEILDARVDAKGVTHPNVGHNVRNLHSELLGLGESIQERITEIQRLLVRVEELESGQHEAELRIEAEMQQRIGAIDAEANARKDADDEIREEIAQEALTRYEQDEALQTQADALSRASLQHSLDLHSEIGQRRKDILQLGTALDSERILREQADADINRNLSQGFSDLTSKLDEEIKARVSSDDNLREGLATEIRTRQSQDEALQADTASERVDRISDGEALQAQADELSQAGLQNSLNVQHEAEHRRSADDAIRRETAQGLTKIAGELNEEAQSRKDADDEIREEIAQEALTRYEQDEALQAQADELSRAGLQHSLNIQNAAEHRRVIHAELKAESKTRAEYDSALSERISRNTEEISGLNENIRQEVSERQAEIASEQADRISDGEALQAQADELSQAGLQNSLNVQQEAEYRRSADDAIRRETAQGLAGLAGALNEETQSRIDTDTEIRSEITQEAFSRNEQDEALQAQNNHTAEAILRTILHVREVSGKLNTALKREETDRIFADENFRAEINALTATIDRALLNLNEALHEAFSEQDEALQAQADNLSKSSLQHSLDLQKEIYQHRKTHEALTAEVTTRAEQHEALRKGLTELQQSLHDEGLARLSDAEAQQEQVNSITKAALRNTLDIQQETSRRKSADYEEAEHRRKADETLQQSLEAAQKSETSIRSNDDSILQKQLDSLVFAVLRIALNDYEARERLRLSIDELFQVVADTGNFTYMGAKIASRSEITDMLADILSGSDSGEISESQIPEALKDKVASSSEVSDMLAEIFPNQNRS